MMHMDGFNFSPVHIADLRPGDIVIHEGAVRTVATNNIKRCSFMGTTIFGDSYMSGHRPVLKAFDFHTKPSKESHS